MSLYASGDKEKVAELKGLAEKMGLEILYSGEKVTPSSLIAAMRPTPEMKRRIGEAVFQMEKRYGELKRPVSPSDITGMNSNYRGTESMSYLLHLAHMRGEASRDPVYKGKKKSFVYSPVGKAPTA